MIPFFERVCRDNEYYLIELEYLGELLTARDDAKVDLALAACPGRMFCVPQVSKIVSYIRKTRNRDPISIYKDLRHHPVFSGATQIKLFLGECLELAVAGGGAYLLERCGHIIDQYRSRSAIEIGNKLIDGAKKDEAIGELLRDCAESLTKISAQTYSATESISDLMADILDDIDRPEGRAEVMEVGIDRMDAMLGGLERGSNTLVGALTSVGKSAFLQSSAMTLAQRGFSVLLFSCEMRASKIGERFLVMRSRLSHAQQRDLSAEERVHIVESANHVGQLPIQIVYCPGWDVERVEEYTHEYHGRNPVDVVMIDYLQLLNTSGRQESDEKRIDYCAKVLRDMGGKIGAATVVAAQLNDEAEGKPPELRHIRGSKAPAQHADNVILMSRNKNTTKDPDIGIWVRKNRNGPLGNFRIPYNPSTYGFGENAVDEAGTETF